MVRVAFWCWRLCICAGFRRNRAMPLPQHPANCQFGATFETFALMTNAIIPTWILSTTLSFVLAREHLANAIEASVHRARISGQEQDEHCQWN